jgi:carbamoyltransferase
MTILGIKLTHDAAFALIDNGKLIFSYEMEKMENNNRYSEFCIDVKKMGGILTKYGYDLEDVDQIVIDGWVDCNFTISIDNLTKVVIKVSEYGEVLKKDDEILRVERFDIKEHNLSYNSYKHIAGHAAAAYCTSPFARKKEDSFVLVWDGGMAPQLLYYQYSTNLFLDLGPLFLFAGFIYSDFACAFKPFCDAERNLSMAGKIMAYIALGKANDEVIASYRRIFDEVTAIVDYDTVTYRMVEFMTREFIKRVKELEDTRQINHDDILASFHSFVGEILVEHLGKKCKEYPLYHNNICLAGGCALNIKWNSSIRNSGIFEDVWVPPFPNDAGGAIGTACCEMMVSDKRRSLQWNVYSGPEVLDTDTGMGDYSVQPCDIEELAYILYNYDEPVVFLNGYAELGPRALGNRSILARPTSPGMKDLLNNVKGRESFRPVAPICLEEDAPEVFEPGFPDPYMLFEHIVRKNWVDRLPAICHLDGSARLQTVNKGQNQLIYQLLTCFKQLSGIPVLCNTSANFNGKGFFPDVKSAMTWGRVNFIWSNGKLYFKNKSFQPGESFKLNSIAV